MPESSNAWTELEIQRLQYGGYLVVNAARPNSGFASNLCAAFSTIDEALDFVRNHILVDAKTPL